MNKFKVGDWVRHDELGVGWVCRITDGAAGDLYGIVLAPNIDFNCRRYVYENALTKLHPKFDNFEELFTDKESITPKYKAQDEVVFLVDDSYQCGVINSVIIEGSKIYYEIIDEYDVYESSILCTIDSIKDRNRQDQS